MHEDILEIRGLPLLVIIGVHPEERHAPQPLTLDIRFIYDASQAAQSDDVRHTIDYDGVTRTLQALTSRIRPTLIENFANAVFEALFTDFPCNKITLCVHKPQGIPTAKDVSLTMTRHRHA